jgi:hypothetical protein
VYGSALANLLRADGRMSGPLPNPEPAFAYGARVLAFVVENMPNLDAIVCMGNEARRAREIAARQDARVGSIRVVDVFHPAARKAISAHEAMWNAAAGSLNSQPPS